MHNPTAVMNNVHAEWFNPNLNRNGKHWNSSGPIRRKSQELYPLTNTHEWKHLHKPLLHNTSEASEVWSLRLESRQTAGLWDTEHTCRFTQQMHSTVLKKIPHLYCAHPQPITLMTSEDMEHGLCCIKHFHAISNPAFERFKKKNTGLGQLEGK